MADFLEECFPGADLRSNSRLLFTGEFGDEFQNDSDDDVIDDFMENLGEERILLDGERLVHEAVRGENFTAFNELKATMKAMEEEPSIFKEVVREGNGPSLSDKPSAKIMYQMFVENKPEPFDTTEAANRGPTIIPLNVGIFPGFSICLSSMRVFEVAKFLIPPSLAFGACGVCESVPPNAVIYAVIEVLAVCTEEEEKNFHNLEAVSTALGIKANGNKAFKEGRYEASIRAYKSALRGMKYSLGLENYKECLELGRTIHVNLAIAYQKIGKPHKAIEHCNLALKAQPEDSKALFHLARSYRMTKQYELAKKILEKGTCSLPNSKDFHDEYQKLCEDMKKL